MLIFIGLDNGYQAGDSETVRQLIEERHGEAVLRLEKVYRTYYSLYFSPVKRSDPRLYKWCVENLTRNRSCVDCQLRCSQGYKVIKGESTT